MLARLLPTTMSERAPFSVLYLSRGASPPGEGGLVRAAAEASGARFHARDAANGGLDPDADLAADHATVLVGSSDLVAHAATTWPAASLLPLIDAGGPGTAPDPDRLAAIHTRPLEPASLEEAIRRAGAHAKILGELHALRRRVDDQGRELRELNRIGIALSSERNRDALLAMILTKCREITSADAGSLYLVERAEGAVASESDFFADKCLLFSLAQNDSVNVPFKASTMAISRQSLAGYAALTGEPLHINDAYAIPDGAEYRFNRAFDTASGYRTKSLLIIPMRNHKDETIGVLQLINRKRDPR